MKKTVYLSCALFWLAASTGGTAASWQRLTPMLLPVQEIYPVLHQQELVVAGGLSSELAGEQPPVTARVQRYLPALQQWQDGMALPEPRHHGYLVSVADTLYLFGGFVTSERGWWTNSRDVLRLDPQAQSWQRVAQLPVALSETVATVIAGKIHLASGRTVNEPVNGQWRDSFDTAEHWIFDPETHSFSQATAVPTARNSAAGAMLDGRWHLVGGRTVAGGNLAVHEVYDPSSKSWSTLAPLPKAQAGLAAVVVNNTLLAFGGEHFVDGGGVFDQVWQYLPAEDRWQALTVLPIARHGHGAVVIDHQVYVIGGAAEAGLKSTLGQLDRLQLEPKSED